MEARVFVDGRITDVASAVVPALDRGFLYGDGVYEVVRTAGRHVVDLGPHLDRLAASAERIRLALPPRDAIVGALEATLAAAGAGEAYARIIVTRGDGEFGLDPGLATAPRLVVIVRPLVRPRAALYEGGAAIRIVSVERTSPRALDPAIKSGNYLNNILALDEARRAGADEAILCDAAGRVAEGASSNVWCVRGGRLETPPLEIGLLPGITRWRVLRLAAEAALPAAEVELRPDDLRAADEVFLTSSIRGVLPVARVDDVTLGVGPVTRRVMALWDAFLARAAAG